MYVRLNCLKNLCLSIVSGVPHFFLGLHPWLRWPIMHGVEKTENVYGQAFRGRIRTIRYEMLF